MPETGSPPEDEQQNTRSVSPLSFLPASRCSTPGISSLDGSPRYLFALPPPPPPRPRSASPLGMAIKPHVHANLGHPERRTKVKSISTQTTGQQEPASVQPEVPSSCEDATQNNIADPIPSWDALTQLYRLEKYQARQCKQVQRQLYQVQSVAARTSRLVHTARSVQRTLAECIKSEDKHSFVNLFNALRDALDCAEATNIYDQTKGADDPSNINYPGSFVDALSPESRNVVLDFLAKVRHDGDFVADRLIALTHKELVSLLPDKGQSRSAESIFGSSPRTSSRTSRHLGFVADGQTELLSSVEYGSPLEALVLSVRGVAHPCLASDPVATDVWSTVCAQLISEQKPGCEKFVPAVINLWAMSSSWPGKERLSMWISQVLQNGLFLLEQAKKQSFRVRTQGLSDPNADDEARTGQYYSSSVNSLLSLLGDHSGASVIPEGALELCHAICRKLKSSQHHEQGFPNFVLTRWLFSSFLPDAITLPEIHGLMTDRFFSDNTRKQVLREIAGRAQKLAFDVVYSWKYGTTVSPEAALVVQNVASRFQALSARDGKPNVSDISHPSKSLEGATFVPVSIADVSATVSALCPRRRMDSISSDFDSSQGGLQSSASSVSGLSLFQSPGSIEAGYRNSTRWTPESQHSVIPEIPRSFSPDNLRSDGRVDSVLQPDWHSDQLLEACASIEDYMSDASSVSSSSWCVLLARADSGSLCTLKEGLLGIADSDTPSGRTSTGNSTEFVNLQKCRETVEELLLSGYVTPDSYGSEHGPGSDLRHLIRACQMALDRRITDFEQDSDFVASHSWFRRRRNFNALVAGENGSNLVRVILNDIKLDKERSVSQTHQIMDLCDTWIKSLKPVFENYGKELQNRSDAVGRLRDKMWYVAEVRPSAAYEEVRLIASALKVMGKPKQPPRTRLAPPLRHWSGSKVSSSGLQMKTEAQTLEILSAPIDYGGPNKLSDDQCKALAMWMERNTVENLCVGEERIHKLCMEIRKAADQVTLENSPLLSSALLARDRATGLPQRRSSSSNPFWPLQAGSGRFDLLTLRTNVPPSIDSLSSASSHPLSARSSRDYLEARSPAMTSRSSAPFWSPVMTEARSPSSATSVGSSQTHAANDQERNHILHTKTSDHNLLERLRQHTLSLLLSELATMTFGEGSETDRAFWTGLGGDLTGKHLLSLSQNIAMSADGPLLEEQFDFDTAFRVLVRRFEASCNPFTKLDLLLNIDTLLVPYMADQNDVIVSRTESKLNTAALQKLKRQGSSQASVKVEGFRRLLCDPTIRPAAIFRDLQYIAALVPSSILESTPQGKAFWNVAVATSSLKQEVRQFMVETADGIISYHSNNRGHGRAASTAQQERDSATFSVPSRTPSAEDIKRYTMADAAYLLQITAKEGDAAAQRELATLYLTHPELMDHIIAPFSQPRDVFKEELESKWRKNQDPNRCDPTTMCVAHHWMSLSSKGGDALAKEYLRQREEMDRLG